LAGLAGGGPQGDRVEDRGGEDAESDPVAKAPDVRAQRFQFGRRQVDLETVSSGHPFEKATESAGHRDGQLPELDAHLFNAAGERSG
jgi:hypothetical protein